MLVDQATIKYPPHMLEEEIEDFIHGLEHNLEHDHLDLETYLKMREMDRETFIENEVKPAAMRRLERSLVMEEFARQEQISVRNEEIQSIYETALQQMQASKQLRKAQAKNRQTPRDMANNIAINTVNNIFNQRLMSRLKAIATGAGDELPAETESVVAESETVEAAEAVEASAASVESPSEPVATEPEAAPQTDEEAGESQA